MKKTRQAAPTSTTALSMPESNVEPTVGDLAVSALDCYDLYVMSKDGKREHMLAAREVCRAAIDALVTAVKKEIGL